MSLQITSTGDLRPGDLGFASIRGRVGAGILAAQAAIDQLALLRGQRADTSGWITHAFLVVDQHTVIEAEPSGARTAPTGDRLGPGYAYARLQLTDAQRALVAARGIDLLGVPYGFSQYAAIAGLTLAGGRAADPHGPLARYVQRRDPSTGRPRRVICSELVDEAYQAAGVELFDDGRPPAYVTPGALFWRAAHLGEVCVL